MDQDDKALQERIREQAYYFWEQEGRPEGCAEFHWHKARQLIEGPGQMVGTDGKASDEPGASIDEQIEDSFPASDPPSYNAGGRLGAPPLRTSNRKNA